jgi:ankyrin repeat protein
MFFSNNFRRSVNELTTSVQTSLHLAAESNLSEVCSILLSNGVDYSAVDSRGNNALHLAVKEGHLAVARVLVNLLVSIKAWTEP